MHPRNPFSSALDLAALVVTYPALASHVRRADTNDGGHVHFDWGSSAALIELCRVLLWHHFGVRWTQPQHMLCPTVPSRLNYLLWIEDLLALRETKSAGQAEPGPIVGVDIGTGASCIYPLLGAACLGWRFVATELDPASTHSAKHNVALNAWEDRIDVRQVEPSSDDEGGGGGSAATLPPILHGVLQPSEHAHFCMCNPPFFDTDETPQPNLATRPHARCAATAGEQFTTGGEVGFVLRLVADSALLREQIVWYTSLVGRKRSLAPILRAVRAAGAAHVRTTEIAQGHTWRWAVAWTFVNDAAPRLLPPPQPTTKRFEAPGLTPAEAWRRVTEFLCESGAAEEVALPEA